VQRSARLASQSTGLNFEVELNKNEVAGQIHQQQHANVHIIGFSFCA